MSLGLVNTFPGDRLLAELAPLFRAAGVVARKSANTLKHADKLLDKLGREDTFQLMEWYVHAAKADLMVPQVGSVAALYKKRKRLLIARQRNPLALNPHLIKESLTIRPEEWQEQHYLSNPVREDDVRKSLDAKYIQLEQQLQLPSLPPQKESLIYCTWLCSMASLSLYLAPLEECRSDIGRFEWMEDDVFDDAVLLYGIFSSVRIGWYEYLRRSMRPSTGIWYPTSPRMIEDVAEHHGLSKQVYLRLLKRVLGYTPFKE